MYIRLSTLRDGTVELELFSQRPTFPLWTTDRIFEANPDGGDARDITSEFLPKGN